MDRKKEEHSILDAIFDIEHQEEKTIADILLGRPSSSDESPTKKKSAPGVPTRRNAPTAAPSLFPVASARAADCTMRKCPGANIDWGKRF